MKADLETGTSAYRACLPEETFRKVSPLLPKLGITRVASQTGLDSIGVPVWCAYTPNAKAIVIAQGKGVTDDDARTSAVMEAVERAVATEPGCGRINSSKSILKGANERFDSVDILLAAGSQPLQDDETTEWVMGRDLMRDAPIWLPFEAISFDRTVERPRYWRSSDGLASGNRRDEAILHGVLERVERDALTLWSLERPSSRLARRLATSGFAHPGLKDMIQKVEAAGLDLALFDITTDLDVACVAALLKPGDAKFFGPLRHVELTLGAGASLDPEIAAARAVAESIQSRMTFIGGARDDLLPEVFSRPVDTSMLAAFAAVPTGHVTGLPKISAHNATEGLAVLVAHLCDRGVKKLYAVDLQPDWLPVNVVKVLAPGLENPDGARRQRLGSRAISRSLT